MEKFLIGVDLGGTNTVFGIVDSEGNIICEDGIKTQSYTDFDDFVEACAQCVGPLIEKVGGKDCIGGMGIGAPNANYYTGAIEYAPNLPWKGFVPISEKLSARLGIKVVITNDANAAAMGEMIYGAARGMKHFILITLGTGIGSGIVIDGKMVYGSDGFAGELGHVTVDHSEGARLCGCGRRGCLETYCSAGGIVQTAKDILAATDTPSLLRQLSEAELSSYAIYKAACEDDAIALEVFKRTGEMLGRACADFTNFCSPEAYIFFGGPMKASQFIMPHMRSAYDANVMKVFKGKCQFLVSELMDRNAAVLGAAALAK